MLTKKDMMKLESLIYLLAIAENSSKRHAAEDMGASIDTMTKYIEYLEKELGIKLLVSNGRGSVLTPDAHKILEESQKVKSVIRQIDLYSLEKREVAGLVRIFVGSYSLIYNILTSNIAEFLQSHPKLSFDIRCQDQMSNLSMLESDISLSYIKPANSDLVIVASHEMALEFCCSPEYIAQYGKPKDLEDLYLNHKLCNTLDSERFIEGWKSILHNFKQVVYNTNTTASVNIMLQAGIGVGLSVKTTTLEKGLIPLEIELPLKLSIYLVTHQSVKDSLKVRTVLDFIKSNLINIKNY